MPAVVRWPDHRLHNTPIVMSTTACSLMKPLPSSACTQRHQATGGGGHHNGCVVQPVIEPTTPRPPALTAIAHLARTSRFHRSPARCMRAPLASVIRPEHGTMSAMSATACLAHSEPRRRPTSSALKTPLQLQCTACY
ncbi:hypothetical protein ACLOJK_004309, partial [Asimina triloba]